MPFTSDSTFDALHRFTSVRSQQGVPLVDADWNELEDIRKFDLSAARVSFFGDGTPHASNGFRVEGLDLPNDFTVHWGGDSSLPDGLATAGRTLAGGLHVITTSDVRFSNQPLHETQPGASALAARLGVPVVGALATPRADGQLTVYLDVWDRLVAPAEDPDLVLPGLGVESCARTKREWVIRVRSGAREPRPGDDPSEYLTGHRYLALALINRRSGDDLVHSSDVVDVRQQNLLTTPGFLITDLLGVSPEDYRRGRGRPIITLRAAVNSLLLGELPGTSDAVLTTATPLDLPSRSIFRDQSGGLVVVWNNQLPSGPAQVSAARLDLANIAAGFPTVLPVTSGVPHDLAHAALLPTGDVFVAYRSGKSIAFKRGPLASLPAATETQVIAAPALSPTANTDGLFVTVSGNIVAIFWHETGGPGAGGIVIGRWGFRRFRITDSTFLDAVAQYPSDLSTGPSVQLRGATTTDGNIWLVYSVSSGTDGTVNLNIRRMLPATGALDSPASFGGNPGTVLGDGLLVCPPDGTIWLFWTQADALHSATFTGGVWTAIQVVSSTVTGDIQPFVTVAADGAMWLTFNRGPGTGIFISRRDPTSGGWDSPRRAAGAPLNTIVGSPIMAADPTGALWIVWLLSSTGGQKLHYRQLIPTI